MEGQLELHGVLILRLRHATQEVASLGSALGLPPYLTWLATDSRDRGPHLLPQARGFNYWSSMVRLSDREFGSALRDIVSVLEAHSAELRKLSNGGGQIELYLQLNGKLNSGDDLSTDILRRLADLNCVLGIETFPELSEWVRGAIGE